jgi:hypothetical protein
VAVFTGNPVIGDMKLVVKLDYLAVILYLSRLHSIFLIAPHVLRFDYICRRSQE